MSGKIYLLQDNNTLREMTEKPYAQEDLLQRLLADYPDLLAGDQIDTLRPRRWLLMNREVGVPLEESGGNRLSIDHLFVDQDATPTLVEVKRSSDTRTRREVVAQMLDYAAHIAYLPVEKIRADFEAACVQRGEDPGQLVLELLQSEESDDLAIVNDFWGKVKTNLQAGKLRLLFVADAIPPELRRVIEFLNAQMHTVEVLAIEVRQYVGESMKMLVPRVFGQTAEAEKKKSVGGRETRQWDEASFLDALRANHGDGAVTVVSRLLKWSAENETLIRWGKGSEYGSWIPRILHKGVGHQVIKVWTNGYIEIPFTYMRDRAPFDDKTKRRELLDRLNEIPGVNFPGDAVDGAPSIRISLLEDEAALSQLIQVLDWFVREVKST